MSKLPWPTKGDKAFSDEGAGKSFQLRNVRYWHLPQHANAFRVAAEMVIQTYVNAPRQPYHDDLVFPVVYLYRHYLELKMKDLIRLGARVGLLENETVQKSLGCHGLEQLWGHVKELLTKRWPDAEDDAPEHVESVIAEFHLTDPDGQTIRYERDRAGKRNKYENLPDLVSLSTLYETMERVSTFFDAAYDGVDAGLQDMEHGGP